MSRISIEEVRDVVRRQRLARLHRPHGAPVRPARLPLPVIGHRQAPGSSEGATPGRVTPSTTERRWRPAR